jgi:transcriptional regulator GlxA family with amidase domain
VAGHSVKHIGIVLFPDVEELDAVGPWEVLSYWTRSYPQDGYAVSCLSRAGGLVTCAQGLTMQAHHSFAGAPPLEVLLYPGGQGTRPQLTDEQQLDWVRRQRATVPLMTSVCTGSLVYAAAGVLSGRPATTHWAQLDLLGELDPSIDVRRNERFVDDGGDLGRRFRGDRHGTASGRPACRHRSRPGGAARNTVRPSPASLTRAPCTIPNPSLRQPPNRL